MGIYSFLQEHTDKDIEILFSKAVDLYNALGSWIYGGTSPRIVYPELQLFVIKANKNSNESFSNLLAYINRVCNDLYKILEENQWIEEHHYESFTIRKTNDITTGLFFMWRLGWLIVKIKDTTNENNITILPHFQNSFENLFDAFGLWIFNQEDLTNITQRFQEFEKNLELEHNSIYDDLLEEANKTKNNLHQFLQKL